MKSRRASTPSQKCRVGLTATPFTKGLGKLYDAVVNVATTNDLIAQGFLVPFRIFSCVEPDMEGVKVVAGEYVGPLKLQVAGPWTLAGMLEPLSPKERRRLATSTELIERMLTTSR